MLPTVVALGSLQSGRVTARSRRIHADDAPSTKGVPVRTRAPTLPAHYMPVFVDESPVKQRPPGQRGENNSSAPRVQRLSRRTTYQIRPLVRIWPPARRNRHHRHPGPLRTRATMIYAPPELVKHRAPFRTAAAHRWDGCRAGGGNFHPTSGAGGGVALRRRRRRTDRPRSPR